MVEFCHRCGAELPGSGVSFCPQCAAPQLYLREYEAQESGGVGTEAATARAHEPTSQVEWRTAMACAGIVGAVAAVLSLAGARFQFFSALSTVWTIGASLITLAMYQKRRPKAWMNGRVGAKIGGVVGLALAAGLAVGEVLSGLIARYGLHAMGAFDARLVQQMRVALERNPSGGALPPELTRLFLSPEFRGGMMLMAALGAGVVLMLLSTFGGAVGGMMRGRRGAQA